MSQQLHVRRILPAVPQWPGQIFTAQRPGPTVISIDPRPAMEGASRTKPKLMKFTLSIFLHHHVGDCHFLELVVEDSYLDQGYIACVSAFRLRWLEGIHTKTTTQKNAPVYIESVHASSPKRNEQLKLLQLYAPGGWIEFFL